MKPVKLTVGVKDSRLSCMRIGSIWLSLGRRWSILVISVNSIIETMKP